MRVNVSASGCLCWHTGGCHSLPWMQWLPQRPPQAVTDPEAAPVVLQQPPQLEAAPGCHGAFANFVSVPASDSMNSVSARSPETWSVCFPVLQGRALCFPASLFKDRLNTKSSRVTLVRLPWDFCPVFWIWWQQHLRKSLLLCSVSSSSNKSQQMSVNWDQLLDFWKRTTLIPSQTIGCDSTNIIFSLSTDRFLV